MEATAALVVSSLAVRLLPSPRLTRLLGRPVGEGEPEPAGDRAAEALRVGWTVERMSGVLPWHPVCLPQAIATRWLLKRRGIPCESHLGISGREPLEAHAWVTACDRVVQGGAVADITALARFR